MGPATGGAGGLGPANGGACPATGGRNRKGGRGGKSASMSSSKLRWHAGTHKSSSLRFSRNSHRWTPLDT